MSLTDTFDNPQSRVEAILQNAMGAEHEVVPQSRVEELLELLDGYLENIEGKITDKGEEIVAAVNAWLEDNPEATTTVQDGALSEPKFSNALKLKTIKDYVTPEMFGAVGDGVADDTEAVQNAINASKYVLCTKKYKLTDEILINKHGINFDARTAEFIYTGNSSAFVLSHINNGFIYINRVTSLKNCIEFRSSVGSSDNTEGVYLYFNNLFASQDGGSCILINSTRPGWSSNNYVYGGTFNTGAYGVRSESDILSMWLFENIMMGNLGCVFRFTVPAEKKYVRFTFRNLRYEEYTSAALFNIDGGGVIEGFLFDSRYDFDIENRFISSGVTFRNFLINAPILRPSISSGTYAYGLWFTTQGRKYLWEYNLDDKTVVDRLAGHATGNITTNSEEVGSGTINYYQNGGCNTIVFNSLVLLHSSGTIVLELPESIKPSYDVPILLYDTTSTVIARGYVNRSGSINIGGVDNTKTYRGTVTYTVI